MKLKTPADKRPVVIGGMGGSGTRLVAEICRKAGVFLGPHLNAENDNLAFTYLFKRPDWKRNASPEEVRKRLCLFFKTQRNRPLDKKEVTELSLLIIPNKGYSSLKDKMQFLKRVAGNGRGQDPPDIWGWKEPNSVIYLDHLADFFPGMKYIHVVRNGFEMATSKNTQQLRNWGDFFGIDGPNDQSELTELQLDYWIKMNGHVMRDAGPQLFGPRFHLVRFEDLILHTEMVIDSLVAFLELCLPSTARAELIQLPKVKPIVSREACTFREDQISAVKELGYTP